MNNRIGKDHPFNLIPMVGFREMDLSFLGTGKILNGGLSTHEVRAVFGHPEPFPKTQLMNYRVKEMQEKFGPKFLPQDHDISGSTYHAFWKALAEHTDHLHYGWRSDMTFGLISHSLPRPAAQLVREHIGLLPFKPFPFKPGVEHKESVINYEPPRMQINQCRDRHGVVVIDYLTLGGDVWTPGESEGLYRRCSRYMHHNSVSGALADTPLHFPYEIDSRTFGPQEPKIPHLKRGGFKGRR